MYSDFVYLASFLLDVIGTVIITYGAIVATVMLAKTEISTRKGKFIDYERVKGSFTQRLILGLDFFIAGDILRTTIMPGSDELLRLAVIVGIRTVLSYFLSKEIQKFRN